MVGGVEYFWAFLDRGVLQIHYPNPDEVKRIREVMKAYQDLPCDLADASLVVASETLGHRQIFTFDHHFYAYRLSDGSSLTVIPIVELS